MIYTIFGFDYIFEVSLYQNLLLAAGLGLYLRLLLSAISHQLWLRNYSQYLVFALLPITGYIITSVISNNIALSLGMVGALSIVRFRTPVKNPSELVIYFCLITLGIVINVNPNTALNFMVFVTFIIVATELFKIVNTRLQIFKINFSHEDFYFMKITTNKSHKNVEEFKEIFHSSQNSNKEFMYQFRSQQKEELLRIKQSFDGENVISFSIDAPV